MLALGVSVSLKNYYLCLNPWLRAALVLRYNALKIWHHIWHGIRRQNMPAGIL
jgi:hypothetical protein